MGVAVVVVVVLAVILRSRHVPGYRHWRGPECGTFDEVQREHLELFFPDASASDEDAREEEGRA